MWVLRDTRSARFVRIGLGSGILHVYGWIFLVAWDLRSGTQEAYLLQFQNREPI